MNIEIQAQYLNNAFSGVMRFTPQFAHAYFDEDRQRSGIVLFYDRQTYDKIRTITYPAPIGAPMGARRIIPTTSDCEALGIPPLMLQIPYSLHGPHGETELRFKHASLVFDDIADQHEYRWGARSELENEILGLSF